MSFSIFPPRGTRLPSRTPLCKPAPLHLAARLWPLGAMALACAGSGASGQDASVLDPASADPDAGQPPLASRLDASPVAPDGGRKVDASASMDAGQRCPQIVASGDAPSIDNFSDGNLLLPNNDGRAGSWFFYDDGGQGTQTRTVEGEGQALHVLSQDWTNWGSGVGVMLNPASRENLACPYNASAHGGLRFRAKGSGRIRVRLAMPENTPVSEGGTCTQTGELCFDWPGTWISLTPDWQVHSLAFCSLVPEGWGQAPPELDPAHLSALHFQLSGDVELWLDDVEFAPEVMDAGGSCPGACPLDRAPVENLSPNTTPLELSTELGLFTFEQETTSCGPITRRYLSYVPSTLVTPSPAPVVIALHGSGANAESMREVMTRRRLEALAKRDGFIVVYGNAAPGAYTSLDPYLRDSGAWRQDFYDDGEVDDVAYLTLLLADLRARGVLTASNPLYLTGLSNGGGMALKAARQLSNQLTGIAAFMPFDGRLPEPIPDLKGARLQRVMIGYAPEDPGLVPDYANVLEAMPINWAKALGIPESVVEQPLKTPLPNPIEEGKDYSGSFEAALATRDSRVTQLDFTHAEVPGQLRVLVFDGAGHFWPNPQGDTEDWALERWGFRNQDLDAADALWDFFTEARTETSDAGTP